VTLGKKIYILPLTQEAVAAPSYCQIFLFLAFLEEAFIRNTIIILCTNCITVILITGNAAVNNNNNYYRRLQDNIWLFKIPKGTRKSFLKIYRKFGQGPSKIFASP
jgi:hypothetical protein